MDLGLAGRVVLITGGSDGLGAAAARALGDEGARVAICARDETRLRRAARELRTRGVDVDATVADVTDVADLARFVASAHDRWGRIDGLINNAGASAGGALTDLDDDVWERDHRLKVLGAVRGCRLAHDALRESGSGVVLNVLSITAKAPTARSMPTSVSRAAGLALTKALSKEWGADGIRVNAVLVGMIRSGQWERMAETRGIGVDEMLAIRARDAGIPLGRVGAAEEFGDLAAFLMSPRSGYVSGVGIALDGGLSASI